ncbi:hypothetical protein K1T71_006215, partial [Dendrolimus kikuchii]
VSWPSTTSASIHFCIVYLFSHSFIMHSFHMPEPLSYTLLQILKKQKQIHLCQLYKNYMKKSAKQFVYGVKTFTNNHLCTIGSHPRPRGGSLMTPSSTEASYFGGGGVGNPVLALYYRITFLNTGNTKKIGEPISNNIIKASTLVIECRWKCDSENAKFSSYLPLNLVPSGIASPKGLNGITCPYHLIRLALNISVMAAIFKDLFMYSVLIVSILVTLHIYLNILISAK